MQKATVQTAAGNTLPIRSYRIPLPAGDEGVRLTVRLMLAKVAGPEGDSHPGVRAWAIQHTAGARDRDDWAQASALFQAVKSKIRFLGEKDETVQTPWLTLQLGAGDCDDHTTLLVALLRSIGIPARIETIATDASKQFSHVFALAGVRQRGQLCEWRPLDSTVSFAAPGWRPPNATRSQVWTSVRDGLGNATSSDTPLSGGTMRMEPGMNGFWHTLFHGSLKAGTIALRTAEGYAKGGPAGAVKAGTQATLHAVVPKKHPKVGQAVQQITTEQMAAHGLAGWPWEREYMLRRRFAPWNRIEEIRRFERFRRFEPRRSEWHGNRYLGRPDFDTVMNRFDLIYGTATNAVRNVKQNWRPAPQNQNYGTGGGSTGNDGQGDPAGQYGDPNWIPGVSNSVVVVGGLVLGAIALSGRR